MELYELPKGWVWTKLGELGEIVTGTTPCKSKKEYYGEAYPFFKPTDLNTGYYVRESKDALSDEGIKHARLLPEKSILVTCIGATIGKTGFVRVEGASNQQINALIPNKNILPEFIYFMCISPKFQKSIIDKASATTLPILNKSKFEILPFPLPPLPEQNCIVAKIEELFTKRDAGVEALKKIKTQLKRYRQSVLKHAFNGKFTNENIKDGELPNNWKWKEIKEITSVLGDGLHGTPKYSDIGNYFFINGNNLSNGKIEIKENTKRVTIEEYEKYKKPLNKRTIFVSINGTLGNTAFYNNEKVILGKSACYFNVLDTIDKRYVRYCITSNRFINYANKTATGSTIKNVGLKAMREFEIPIPTTLEEQQLIVDTIETHFSSADKVQEIVDKALTQAERLRQSILKTAFEGRLVPQDPTDEPASVLLERIKKEKEKLEKVRKTKGKIKRRNKNTGLM
ncbi:MAG: restriction endonuclease subunit S [Nanoarchaeota archaeon]|nr:restriction endonuclease subunit S [Nitrospinota bacterium]MCG2718395.1 restriction endonuclease subunit S [Nanoarchaeota archaeon]